MADYTLTIRINENERAVLDTFRGEVALEEFAHTALLVGAAEAAQQFPLPEADELISADHIRLAAAAEANAIDIDELERLVWQDIREYQAARGASTR